MSGMDAVEFVGGPEPGFEIGFALVGALASDGSAQRVITLYCEKNSLGEADDDELSAVYTKASDLETFFGGGSASVACSPGAYFAHLIFDMIPNARVRGLALAPIGAGVIASNTIVFTGPATAAGTCKIWLDTVLFSFDFASGDSATDIGDKCVAAFNKLTGKNRPPIKMANAAGTVTVTAAGEGTAYNGFPMSKESISGAGAGCTVTGNLASGSGTYSHATGLAAMANERTGLIASMYNDTDGSTGELDLLLDAVLAKVTPQTRKWTKIVAAKSDTRTNLATWVDTLDTGDTERVHLFGYKGALNWEPTIAVEYAAAIASKSRLVVPINGTVLKHLRPPVHANRWDASERALALQSGFASAKVVDEQVCVNRYIHARYDKGVIDGNVVDVLDWVAIRLENRFASLGPLNYVPAPATASGPGEIDDEGVRGEVELELVAVEKDDRYLYDAEGNIEKVTVTYMGGGAIKVFIPASCLKVIPGMHNVMVEGEHQLDAA